MHQTNLFSRKHILLVIVTVLALSLMAIPALARHILSSRISVLRIKDSSIQLSSDQSLFGSWWPM